MLKLSYVMKKNIILLSSGSVPWMTISDAASFATKTGFDGIELLPTRRIVSELKKMNALCTNDLLLQLKNVKSIHQSWRLDIGNDNEYGFTHIVSFLATFIRLFLFPKPEFTQQYISALSEKLDLPVTVHDLSSKWTADIGEKEFKGGIYYELIGTFGKNPSIVKRWLKLPKHGIVLDTRDDQSLLWAKKYGFANWQAFWQWIGLSNIKNIQLTLIGSRGMKNIFIHAKSLAEDQFLFLHNNNWSGSITAEINPLTLFLLSKGDLKKGMRIISSFVRHTLHEGNRWS